MVGNGSGARILLNPCLLCRSNSAPSDRKDMEIANNTKFSDDQKPRCFITTKNNNLMIRRKIKVKKWKARKEKKNIQQWGFAAGHPRNY
jgi:hypothetical protein